VGSNAYGEPKEMRMSKFFRLSSAGPLFFVSAWRLMLFACPWP
jgi:hypothetical protein